MLTTYMRRMQNNNLEIGLRATRGAHNNFMLLDQEKFKRVPDFLSTAL